MSASEKLVHRVKGELITDRADREMRLMEMDKCHGEIIESTGLPDYHRLVMKCWENGRPG